MNSHLSEEEIERLLAIDGKKLKHAEAELGRAISLDDWIKVKAMRRQRDEDHAAKVTGMRPRMSDEQRRLAASRRAADIEAMRRAQDEKTDVARAAVTSRPTYALWDKEHAARALRVATEYRPRENPHVLSAILMVLSREARRRGWTIRKQSVARDGRINSIYVTPPGLSEVRISDHPLPQTHTRQLRENFGVKGRWLGEVLIEHIIDYSLDEMIECILEAAGKEDDNT